MSGHFFTSRLLPTDLLLAECEKMGERHAGITQFDSFIVPVKQLRFKTESFYKLLKRSTLRDIAETAYKREFNNNFSFIMSCLDILCAERYVFKDIKTVDGIPRVIGVALFAVENAKGNIDSKTLAMQIKQYQRFSPLGIDELILLKSACRCALLSYLSDLCAVAIKISEKEDKATRDANEGKFSLNDIHSCEYVSTLYKAADSVLKQSVIDLLTDNGIRADDMINLFEFKQADLYSSISGVISSLRKIDDEIDDEFILSLSQADKFLTEIGDKNYIASDVQTKMYYLRLVSSNANGANETVFLSEQKALYGDEMLENMRKNSNKHCKFVYYSLFVFLVVMWLFVAAIINFSLLWLTLPIIFTIGSFLRIVISGFVERKIIPTAQVYDEQKRKTIVVMCALVSDKNDAARLQSSILEIKYGNPGFKCALLIDFPSSENNYFSYEEKSIIEQLKKAAKSDGYGLVVRKRRKNVLTGKFEPYEKKRGALCELNAYLLNKTSDFYACEGIDRNFEYVITLDEDNFSTKAARLCSVMAHPANKKIAVAALRASNDIASASKNIYTKIFENGYSGNYDQDRTDFNRDVFSYGNYTGKGIYRVKEFYEKTADAFPDNAILSHDFIEGAFSGCANTDFTVLENCPQSFSKSEARRNRWLRDDIQLLRYLFPYVKNKTGENILNPLCFAQKMHILSNILASLVPVFLFLALTIFCFTCNTAGIVLTITIMFFPLICLLFSCAGSFSRIVKSFISCYFETATLAYKAVMDFYTLVITLVRLGTGKNLLRWNTFAKDGGKNTYVILSAVATAIYLIIGALSSVIWFYIFAVVFASAVFLGALSKKQKNAKKKISVDLLKNIAKDTWRYYEVQFEKHEYLICDNCLCEKEDVFAKRTSPTNIGMSLTACVCALVNNFIDRKKFDEITYGVLSAVSNLEKWYGHLYNWYGTESGNVLYPSYVSTVDSGNFFMCLCYIRPFLASQCCEIVDCLIENVDFMPLFDVKKNLLHIGYNKANNSLDAGHYDLAASEALIGYIFCLGYEKIPMASATALKRKFSLKFNCQYSWTGGCFEYLMPWLFVKFPEKSDFYESAISVVSLQKKHSVAGIWGVSESQYARLDESGNYRYKAFGISKVALCENVSGEVRTPYATFLCLPFAPKEAMENAGRLCRTGAYGKYGFYEAIDGKIIKSFMAHHQGMILMSITNYLTDFPQKKLQKNPHISCAVKSMSFLPEYENYPIRKVGEKHVSPEEEQREFSFFGNPYSEINLISGGEYYFITGQNGNGRAVFGDNVVYDQFIGGKAFTVDAFLNEEQCKTKKVIYLRGKTIIERTVNEVEVCEEISPLIGFDGEMRSLTFENRGNLPVNIDVCGSFELILEKAKVYIAHPAFNRLFISIFDRKGNVALCENRKSKAFCGFSLVGADADFFLDDGIVCGKSIITLLPGETKKIYFCLFCANDKPELYRRAKVLGDENPVEKISDALLPEKANGMSIDECRLAARLMNVSFGCNVLPDKAGYSYNYPVNTVFVKCASDIFALEKKLKTFIMLYKYGLMFEVVISVAEADGYFSRLKNEVESAVRASGIYDVLPHDCKTEIVSEKIGEEISKIFAEYYIDGTLSRVSNKTFYLRSKIYDTPEINLPEKKLSLSCGYFAPDCSFIITKPGKRPFCNVIANSEGGTIITSRGGGFSFGKNSREEKTSAFLTYEACSELLFVSEKGNSWKINGLSEITKGYCRQNLGATEFVLGYNGIKTSVSVFITENGSKAYSVDIENLTDENRKVEIGFAIAPVLGDFFENHFYHIEFTKVADNKFCVVNTKNERKAWIIFSGAVFDIKNDNCDIIEKTMQKSSNLPYFSTMSDIVFGIKTRIGILIGSNAENEDFQREACRSASAYKLLSCIDVNFDSGLSVLAKWLPYQVYCSRFYGRAGYYQISGAYGFRDQLQDCLTMLYIDCAAVKKHIIRCAEHQFADGDVMHWWHEPFFGVRTRIMDDRLFLPYIVSEYISFTGDCFILAERIPFLKNVIIPKGEGSVCCAMEPEKNSESLLEHCKRAIVSVCEEIAPDGLVYMHGGDWNDGMNLVGAGGKGRSVWLSMFLYEVIGKFARYITLPSEKKYYFEKKALLKAGVEACFNGKYFIRAIADDGTILGNEKSAECKMDLLTQAYAAISGITTAEKALSAVECAEKVLVDEKNGIIKLLDPPFEHSEKVGYIGDYPPGVRENGGQYTHAAVWFVYALYELGQTEKAFKYLTMLNPVEHYRKYNGDIYGAEPYVMSADVYSGKNTGKAGWSWYTGSASWMYVTIIKKLFGIEIKNGVVSFSPNLPSEVKRAFVTVRYEGKTLNVNIDNGDEGEQWRIVYGEVEYNTNTLDLKNLKNDKTITLKRSR